MLFSYALCSLQDIAVEQQPLFTCVQQLVRHGERTPSYPIRIVHKHNLKALFSKLLDDRNEVSIAGNDTDRLRFRMSERDRHEVHRQKGIHAFLGIVTIYPLATALSDDHSAISRYCSNKAIVPCFSPLLINSGRITLEGWSGVIVESLHRPLDLAMCTPNTNKSVLMPKCCSTLYRYPASMYTTVLRTIEQCPLRALKRTSRKVSKGFRSMITRSRRGPCAGGSA